MGANQGHRGRIGQSKLGSRREPIRDSDEGSANLAGLESIAAGENQSGKSGTGAYTSTNTGSHCSCTGGSGKGKTDIVGSLASLVKLLSAEVDDGTSKTSKV
jgi:hypothetical protein